jgi:hypothetical protein
MQDLKMILPGQCRSYRAFQHPGKPGQDDVALLRFSQVGGAGSNNLRHLCTFFKISASDSIAKGSSSIIMARIMI